MLNDFYGQDPATMPFNRILRKGRTIPILILIAQKNIVELPVTAVFGQLLSLFLGKTVRNTLHLVMKEHGFLHSFHSTNPLIFRFGHGAKTNGDAFFWND